MPLAKRFFPVSFRSWEKENPGIAKLFADAPVLDCWHCEGSLLHPKPHGIVVIWTSLSEAKSQKEIRELYWCCKGRCDDALRQRYSSEEVVDGWEDISDIVVPIAYIRFIMAALNQFQRGETMSEDAFKNYKRLLLNLYPLVARDMTSIERKRISLLSTVPAFLGGWGSD